MTPLILISTFTFGFVCGNFFPFPLLLEEDEKEQYLTKENSYGKKEIGNVGKGNVVGFTHNNITFGHIHMAKTGGTSLNGLLALNYERVCGHKGYSYDYYQANIRFNGTTNWMGVIDLYSKMGRNFNRGRVFPDILYEIGFEDCDWISHEIDASFWKRFVHWHTPIELHLPCRDPIDHLMSQCNHKHIKFNCSAPNLDSEIKKCIAHTDRFNSGLNNGRILPEGSVKCYDYKVQFTKYMKLMEGTLQTKKVTSDYVHRGTNEKRGNDSECIWNSNAELRDKVSTYLVQNSDYYSFCDSCIGSKDDLFATVKEV